MNVNEASQATGYSCVNTPKHGATDLKEIVKVEFAKRCPAPWISLLAFANGEFAPCCFIMSHGYDLQNHETMDGVWNSGYMVRMRKLISEERYSEAGCLKSCIYLNGKSEPPYESTVFTGNLTDEYYKTPYLGNILDDYWGRRHIVSSRPAILSVVLFNHCNLRCVMCPQDHDDKSRLGYDSLSMLFSEPEYLSSVSLVGGELFADKRFSKYFSTLPFKEGGNPNTIIFTNGLLLDQERLNDITAKIFPSLLFSIDGATRQAYNKIRVGSDFDVVIENLRRAAAHYRRHGCQRRITWHYLVMKSSLQDLETAYGICEELGITFEIEKVMGYFPQENFFDFPYVLESSSDVSAAMSFLAKGRLATHSRAANILAGLNEAAGKMASMESFLFLSPERAVELLTDTFFMKELINACLYGYLKNELCARLAVVFPLIKHIPEKSHIYFLILLNMIPEGAPGREKAVCHIGGLMPAWAENGPVSSDLPDAISSILGYIHDLKLDSLTNSTEIINGIARLMAPDISDEEKGASVKDEALGACLLWGNPRFGKEGGLYEFLDRYLNEAILDWNVVTPSWGILLYRLASWRESMKMTEKASELFEHILDIPDCDDDLLAGTRYHLACLANDCGDKDSARGHCLECLKINTAHKAAGDLIARLNA